MRIDDRTAAELAAAVLLGRAVCDALPVDRTVDTEIDELIEARAAEARPAVKRLLPRKVLP